MADSTDPGRHKDPTIETGDGGDNGPTQDVPPIPAVRRRHAQAQKTVEQAVEQEEGQETKQLETSTVTRTYMKTITTSLTTSSSSQVAEHASSVEIPTQRLRQKVAQYEKVWSDGAGKRPAEQCADELRQEQQQSEDFDAENPFEIDVHEIERRLREERQRGLAEAEAAKLAFQQVHLRHTPQSSPRRVEVTSEQIPSPFNVTLKTTSRMSPGAELGNVEDQLSSPFNVTLRTTRRTVKSSENRKKELESFLDGERMVREVQAADGVRTIITSSMTSDGGYAEEKIYRHGEGYVSPRDSPSWSRSSVSSERSSVTSPHSVDMTAGGRRILIKLEDEMDTMRAGACEHEQQRDETDGSVRARIRQFGGQDELVDAMATGNIDITVGSNPRRRRLYQQTTLQVGGNETATATAPQQQQQPRAVRPSELSWQTGKSTTTRTTKTRTTTKTMLTSTPIGTKEQPQTATPVDDDHDEALVSPVATCQLRGSSTEESRKIVSHKTITSTTTKSASSSASASGSTSASRKSIALVAVNPPHAVDNSFTATQIRIGDNANANVIDNDGDNDDDSDTEGVPASSLVIVSTPTRTTTPTPTPTTTTTSPCTPHMLSGVGTFSKSLRQDYQTQAAQSSRGNEQEQEIQEFQSTMASINFARSNSQYDSHIKEKRGKLMPKKETKIYINIYRTI